MPEVSYERAERRSAVRTDNPGIVRADAEDVAIVVVEHSLGTVASWRRV